MSADRFTSSGSLLLEFNLTLIRQGEKHAEFLGLRTRIKPLGRCSCKHRPFFTTKSCFRSQPLRRLQRRIYILLFQSFWSILPLQLPNHSAFTTSASIASELLYLYRVPTSSLQQLGTCTIATQYSGNAPLTWSKHSVATIDGAVIDVWRVACDAPQYPTANRPAVIHVHGGGFISGGKEYEEFQNFQLTQQRHDWLQVSGIVCLYVSYRLAYDGKKMPAPDGKKMPAPDGTETPASDGTETPASDGTERPKISFPTPFTDVYSAILWANNESHARMLGIDRANITVVGVSAGGCLAYQAAALARDENLNPPIARLNLMYPMLDPSQVKDGWKNHADFGIVIEGKPATWKTLLRMGWNAYLPLEPIDKAKYDKYAEYAEPLKIKAKGMPPTLLEVGDKDHFLEEDVELGEIMKKDGVPVKIVVYKGLAHDFERRPELLPWYSAWQLPYALSVRLAFLMKVDFKAPDVEGSESELKVGVAGTGGEISTN